MARICIIGAGAIGGVLGAHLVAQGAEVTFVVRGAHLKAMRERGLTLNAQGATRTLAVTATDDPGAAAGHEVVVCAAKAHSLPALAAPLGRALDPGVPVVFAVNGVPWWYCHALPAPLGGRQVSLVDPEGTLWREIGPERAIGCVVYMGASLDAPGAVTHHSGGRFVLGEPDGTVSERLRLIAAALAAPPIKPEATARIRDEILGKMIGTVSFNPIAALTRRTIGQIVADPGLRALCRQVMLECAAVGERSGARLPFDIETKLETYAPMTGFKPSTLQDVELGRPLEVDALVGAVAELGRMLEVPTPAIDGVHALARGLAIGLGLHPGRAMP